MHEFPDNTPSLRINDEYFQVITKIKTQLKKNTKKTTPKPENSDYNSRRNLYGFSGGLVDTK